MNPTNLKKLRKSARLTQEAVAEWLNVSRQSVAKWESGESLPDIDNCIALARLYNVTLDDLVTYAKNPDHEKHPVGKHIFGVAKINEKGQITLPEKACQVFELKPGDKLLLLGDENQGIAMCKLNRFFAFTSTIMEMIQQADQEEEKSTGGQDVRN